MCRKLDVGSKREERQIKLKANELVYLNIRKQGTALWVMVSVARTTQRATCFASFCPSWSQNFAVSVVSDHTKLPFL